MPAVIIFTVLLHALLSSSASSGAESYPFPGEAAGFPFPVRRVYNKPLFLYRISLEPGLGLERRRIRRELRHMVRRPSRIAVKGSLTALMEIVSLSWPGSRGWLGTHTPDTLARELTVAAWMAVLNREVIPRIPGTMAFESHFHSLRSHDSAADLEAALIRAARKGLQAVAITDHNTIAGARRAAELAETLKAQGQLPPDFVVVVGEEISTRQGHVIGLFLTRRIPQHLTALETITEIQRQGGVAVAPHPGIRRGGLSRGLIRRLPFDAVEIGNGSSFLPFDFFLARYGNEILHRTTLFGMDSHFSQSLGWLGYNRVYVTAPTAVALKEALLAGRTAPVFSGPYGPYRKVMEVPAVTRFYRIGASYFSLIERWGAGIAAWLGIDDCRLWTGYDLAFYDLLNLIPANEVISDFSNRKGVFGASPEFGVIFTQGRFTLSYRVKAGGEPEHEVNLKYRWYF